MKRLFVCTAVALAILAPAGASAHGEAAPEPKAPGEAAGTAIPLEKRSYIKNMKVLGRFFSDTERAGKFQMMTIGDKRYLFHSYIPGEGQGYSGVILDISNPLKPTVVKDAVWRNTMQQQLAWNDELKKWILIVGYTALNINYEGLRGVKIFDVTNPESPQLLSQYSVDGGDPDRKLQLGSGTHRFWYDGGKYLYLSAVPNNDYYFLKYKKAYFNYAYGLQVVDVSDPAHPRRVTDWHFPGQRLDESKAREAWPFASDPAPMAIQHGPIYIPKRVEDGGKLGYGAWGAFGMVIQDFSDIQNPKVVSTWRPTPSEGPQIAVHTVDVARLDRGFVITNPEAFEANCREPMIPSSIVDVTDPANPKQISDLPTPTPPKEAPYKSFCERYGRFGPHNPPHVKAPGKADPNFTCYTYFNGGLQCFDITDPRRPFITAYFVPEQGTPEARPEVNPTIVGEWIRTADNVFVEWDRKLIWLAADSGLYLLSAEKLGKPVLKPMAVKTWVLSAQGPRPGEAR